MKRVFVVTAAAALLAGSADASTIYSNGPYNGTLQGVNFSGGFAIADSFTVGAATKAWDLDFVTWNGPGNPLTSVTWSIWTGNPFGGGSPTEVAFGTAAPGLTLIGPNGTGFDLYSNSIDLGGVSLGAGTYWLELSDGIAVGGVFWDDNNGPSSAWQGGGLGDLTNCCGITGTNSEAFSIGSPEPATWAVMLAGFAGLGAALRSRRRRPAAA